MDDWCCSHANQLYSTGGGSSTGWHLVPSGCEPAQNTTDSELMYFCIHDNHGPRDSWVTLRGSLTSSCTYTRNTSIISAVYCFITITFAKKLKKLILQWWVSLSFTLVQQTYRYNILEETNHNTVCFLTIVQTSMQAIVFRFLWVTNKVNIYFSHFPSIYQSTHWSTKVQVCLLLWAL